MSSPTKNAVISDKDVLNVYVRQHLVPRPPPRVNIGRKFESCNMTSETKASYDTGQYAGYNEFVPRQTPKLDIGR